MTVQVNKSEMVRGLAPAFNILWSIHCDVQGHPCFYNNKIMFAIDGLVKLLEKT